MKFEYQVSSKDEISKRNLSGFGLSGDDYYFLDAQKKSGYL